MSDDYIPWGEREEFKDIVPILQDDGPEDATVIRIPYTPECTFQVQREVNNLFVSLEQGSVNLNRGDLFMALIISISFSVTIHLNNNIFFSLIR